MTDVNLEDFSYVCGRLLRNGKSCGSTLKNGYRVISIKSKLYYEHRLVWLYHYNKWPSGRIDHINGICDDNRIENLRESTASTNGVNGLRPLGTSKYRGVDYRKSRNRWRCRVVKDGMTVHTSHHKTEKEAALMYNKVAVEYYKDYVRLNNVI